MYNRYEYFRKRGYNLKVLKEVPQSDSSTLITEDTSQNIDSSTLITEDTIPNEEHTVVDTSQNIDSSVVETKKRRGRRKTNTNISPDTVDTKEVDVNV